jgi:hypothetical protein
MSLGHTTHRQLHMSRTLVTQTCNDKGAFEITRIHANADDAAHVMVCVNTPHENRDNVSWCLRSSTYAAVMVGSLFR